MAPPKRALFSVNLDTDADHVYQRVEDYTKDGKDRVSVLETKGPTVGHTDLKVLTRPFERIVDRTVQGVVEGTGKKVDSVEGSVQYETHRSEKGTSSGRTSVKKNSKKSIEDQYDTSDL